MKFKHNHFLIDVDTNSESICKTLKNLEILYKRIPCTICLFCPKKQTVEADCCKHFSPPMYLMEFINALKRIETLSENEEKLLFFSCYESFLNPTIIRPCVLLKNNRCSIYGDHPFSCHLYPSYPKQEWEKRLKRVSLEWGIPIDKIPMKNQCSNVRIDGKIKKISMKEEDDIFRDIANLDIKLFENDKIGEEIVYSAATYLPFDAHYLLMKIGPDKVEELSDIRLLLIEKNQRFFSGKLDRTDLNKLESEAKDLLNEIKNKIFQNQIKDYIHENNKG